MGFDTEPDRLRAVSSAAPRTPSTVGIDQPPNPAVVARTQFDPPRLASSRPPADDRSTLDEPAEGSSASFDRPAVTGRASIEPLPSADDGAAGQTSLTAAQTPAPHPSAGAPASDAATVSAAAGRPRHRRSALRLLGLVAGLAVLSVVGVIGFGAYRDSQLYVSTDNAELSGTPIQVGAMNAGRVAAVHPTVGSAVRAGDVVAQVALPTQIGVAQSGQPKLAFLGQADTRVDVQSPIDGVVLAVQTAVGASVQAGQPIVTVTDPGQLWVNANIDETSIARVKVGQPATVHLDALGEDVPGRVEAITPATASSFSLLPQANTTGSFSKVTQVVPVRIAVNIGNQPALLGTSVEVKIRVD